MATTPYNLLVDVGNTFVKWGRYRATGEGVAADNCIESGHALLAEIPELAAAWRKFPAPHRIVISNVAGTRARSTMIRVLEVWPDGAARRSGSSRSPSSAGCGTATATRPSSARTAGRR